MSGEFYFHNYDADLRIYSGGLLSQVNSHRHNPEVWCGIATVRLQHMRWCENTNSSDVQIQIPRTFKITIGWLEILSFWFIAYCASFTCLRFPKEKTAANNCMLTTIQFLWRLTKLWTFFKAHNFRFTISLRPPTYKFIIRNIYGYKKSQKKRH
jgi:hypothetical protein